MGIRFRKSVSFGKFFRLNLSKSGVSLGVGTPGFNVNVGPRGVRRTVGLPGTGVYYQESHQWPKSTAVEPAATTQETASDSALGWKIIGIALALIALVAYLGGGTSTTAPKQPTTVTTPAPSPPVTQLKPDRPLSRDEVRELQTLLNKHGFNAGTADGFIGPKTRAAAQAFTRAHQMKVAPAEPTLRVLDAARGR